MIKKTNKKTIKYDFQTIEKKWQKYWAKNKVYEPDLENAKKPFYNLMMFPYPSAEGLHVGNMYAFTGSDIYGRFKRMRGYDVFEPIGLDGFGIHSENYSLKIGTHPMEQSKISEKRFYKQLEMIGNGFAWNERLETYDPEYYRWTQWIFVQMWRHRLAYRKKQAVNWCPSCKTVLSDEQVISEKCERCETIVIKKELEQWFFRITKYAEKLLVNLDAIDWSEKVKIAQRNWIGKSEGAEIEFPISNFQFPKKEITKIKVFTTRPDTLFGATYLVLAQEHDAISNFKFQISNYDEVEKYVIDAKKKSEEERIENKDLSAGLGREKTGVELKGIKAINPANNEEIPIFVADYVFSGYGTGAVMAVPAHDERDFEFAKKYNLPIKMVVCPNYPKQICPILDEAYIGVGRLVDSGKFDGMDSDEAKEKITKFVGGKLKTQYHLRDWLISRQRYWGAPIPMIYCEECAKVGRGEQKEMPGWYAAPEKDLPVGLPFIKKFRPQGTDQSPLASVSSFYETICPACGEKARRETDVSDTFLDSAWYYLRYPSINAKNSILEIRNLKLEIPWNQEITRRWFPVNLYTGGAEHSVLHLLYVRFVALALRDMKFLDFPSKNGEPFPFFRAHGLLIRDGAKMSKSKGNVVNPDKYIQNFGADTFRIYLMFLAPFEQGGDFRDAGILGPARFLERIYKLFHQFSGDDKKQNSEIKKALHQTIKKVTEDIESLHYNTAISALMILLNEMEKNDLRLTTYDLQLFLKLLAPFAPHLAEELWEMLGNKNSIHTTEWPEYDEKIIQEDKVQIVVQINGKHKATLIFSKDANQKEVEKISKKNESVKKTLAEQNIKRVVFIKNKLINFVI